MKCKFLLVLSNILFLTFIGCKGEKDIDSLEVLKPDLVEKTFKVTLKVIVKKNDDLALFYTTDGSTNFKDGPIWQEVKGSESLQDVVFVLPEGLYPTQLRLDFGQKQDQENITLQSVKMDYKGKTREIIGAELTNFFRADDSKCTFDPATGLIKAIGQTKAPSLYPHETNLGPEIAKLAK